MSHRCEGTRIVFYAVQNHIDSKQYVNVLQRPGAMQCTLSAFPKCLYSRIHIFMVFKTVNHVLKNIHLTAKTEVVKNLSNCWLGRCDLIRGAGQETMRSNLSLGDPLVKNWYFCQMERKNISLLWKRPVPMHFQICESSTNVIIVVWYK